MKKGDDNTKKKAPMDKKASMPQNQKTEALQRDTSDGEGQFLTTNQGVKINDNNNTLKAGERGPSLLEDFIFREKMTHFDHERIPERIVHARGSGAHGVFKLYEDLSEYTSAGFLTDTSRETPVFARFSTVVGFRGSTDMPRDVRGFAVKFYTEEGNFDLVGNNMPVFFIQDAMKFPDLVHAVKPEPHHEMPQAAAAHDNFWDFISLMPESMHMILWVLSDRALPRSLRMMEGFGVHTFRLVNKDGEAVFVKFHWKPLLGMHAVTWDESQKISGKDPDYHRRDLWENIEKGNYPEWELGLQIIPEADEHKYPFDLLDPTKLVPEELVPVKRVGKMTLNRNPANFFAETEQIAFHPGHVVPGIDFTNDPLLQGRLFSYTDTQLSRLGSPNFHEIPINRPISPAHNNQRDGHMRQTIDKGTTNYHPNTVGGGCPFQAKMAAGGFVSYTERIDAVKIRNRSESFRDHFSQATLFYNSQTEVEKQHIIDAFSFELGKVERTHIRERIVGMLTQVDKTLAAKVAENLGLKVPSKPMRPMNHSVSADREGEQEPIHKDQGLEKSEALSMMNGPYDTIKTRQIAFLAAHGANGKALMDMKKTLEAEGAMVKVLSQKLGKISVESGDDIQVDGTFLTDAAVLYDAVYVAGGQKSVSRLASDPDALHFVNEAFRHCKAIATEKDGTGFLKATYITAKDGDRYDGVPGLLVGQSPKDFVSAIAKHRFWEREMEEKQRKAES